MIAVMYRAGLRCAELIDLMPKDLDEKVGKLDPTNPGSQPVSERLEASGIGVVRLVLRELPPLSLGLRIRVLVGAKQEAIEGISEPTREVLGDLLGVAGHPRSREEASSQTAPLFLGHEEVVDGGEALTSANRDVPGSNVLS